MSMSRWLLAALALTSAPSHAAIVYNVDVDESTSSFPIGKVDLPADEYSVQFTSTGPAWLIFYRFQSTRFCNDYAGYPICIPNGAYEQPWFEVKADAGSPVSIDYLYAVPFVYFGPPDGNHYETRYRYSYSIRTYDPFTGETSPIGTNIQLTIQPVPEPATWAMMIGGLGLVGAALRSRRRPLVAETGLRN